MKTLKTHLLAITLPAAALIGTPAIWAANQQDSAASDQKQQDYSASTSTDPAQASSNASSPGTRTDAAANASTDSSNTSASTTTNDTGADRKSDSGNVSAAAGGNATAQTTDQGTAAAAAQQGQASSDPSARPMSAQVAAQQPVTGEQIQVATDDAEKHSDQKLAGRNVDGSAGKSLGDIKDFLIDPASGKAEFAMISSGGIAGLGDKVRLVPLQALKPGDKDDTYRLDIDEAKWEQIAPVDDDRMKEENFTVTDSERREIRERFGAAADTASAPYTAGITHRLVLASELRGKDVRSGPQEIGKLEGVVIDLQAGTAKGLLDPDRDFAGTSQKFLLPLTQITLVSDRDAVITTITREQIDQATGASQISSSSSGSFPVATDQSSQTASSDQSAQTQQASTSADADATASNTTSQGIQASASGQHAGDQSPNLGLSGTASPARTADASDTRSSTTTTTPSRSSDTDSAAQGADSKSQDTSSVASNATTQSTEPALSPTGRTSADQTPSSSDAGLVTAAQSVRSALDQDTAMAQLDVTITPEDGKLVLKGKVDNDQTKKKVEQAAERAAGGKEIDSQLTVEDK